jgi:hypothetical protein
MIESKMVLFKYIFIYLTIILCCLIINPALAGKKNARTKKEMRFPVGCKQSGYKFDLYNVIFTPSTKKYSQTIYFIKNISNKAVHLLQASDGNDPYILHIDGKIASHRWSVLSVSEHRIKFICTNYNKRKNDRQVINCQNVLRICEFSRSRFGTNHRGTYWLTLSKSRRSAVNITRFHGVLLSDPRQIEEDIEKNMEKYTEEHAGENAGEN